MAMDEPDFDMLRTFIRGVVRQRGTMQGVFGRGGKRSVERFLNGETVTWDTLRKVEQKLGLKELTLQLVASHRFELALYQNNEPFVDTLIRQLQADLEQPRGQQSDGASNAQ